MKYTFAARQQPKRNEECKECTREKQIECGDIMAFSVERDANRKLRLCGAAAAVAAEKSSQ